MILISYENNGSYRTKFRGLILVAIAVFSLSACANIDRARMAVMLGENRLDRSMDYYALGREHFRAGRHGLAIQAFHMSLIKEGEDPDTLNALGASYDKIHRFGLAKRYYARALMQRRDSPVILNNLGYSLLLQGKPDQAIQYLQRARNLRPDQPRIEANLNKAMRAARRAVIADANSDLAQGQRELTASIPRMPKVWLQRTSKAIRTLITRPNERFLALAAARGVNPGLVMHLREAGERTEPQSDASASSPISTAAMKVGRVETHEIAATTAAFQTVSALPQKAEHLLPSEPTALRARKPNIEVSNGAGRRYMARRLKGHLTVRGWAVSALTNARHFGYRKTVIFVRPEYRAEALALSEALPDGIKIRTAWPSQNADILIRIGGDLLDFDKELLGSMRDV